MQKIKNILKYYQWYLFVFYTKFFTKAIVWDFDGTFYDGEVFFKALQNAYWNYYKKNVSRISKKKFLNTAQKHRTLAEFVATKVSKTPQQIANEVDVTINKEKFYVLNKSVKNIINLLPNHRHLILSNAQLKDITTGLKIMKFIQKKSVFKPFEVIFSRDNGISKPHFLAFEQVLKHTKLPKYTHLMIGDELENDILPAKKFGFTTLLASKLPKLENTLRKL